MSPRIWARTAPTAQSTSRTLVARAAYTTRRAATARSSGSAHSVPPTHMSLRYPHVPPGGHHQARPLQELRRCGIQCRDVEAIVRIVAQLSNHNVNRRLALLRQDIADERVMRNLPPVHAQLLVGRLITVLSTAWRGSTRFTIRTTRSSSTVPSSVQSHHTRIRYRGVTVVRESGRLETNLSGTYEGQESHHRRAAAELSHGLPVRLDRAQRGPMRAAPARRSCAPPA